MKVTVCSRCHQYQRFVDFGALQASGSTAFIGPSSDRKYEQIVEFDEFQSVGVADVVEVAVSDSHLYPLKNYKPEMKKPL